ncbi:MAG: S8 family serine peptidase [candidate division SR1 bacterium]|nr:S8 family serine peptidase [candidate division SR1 bacterium]
MQFRKYRFIGSSIVLSIAIGASSFVLAQNTEIAVNEQGMEYVPGELIIKFESGEINLQKSHDVQILSQMETTQDFDTTQILPKENIVLVTIDETKNMDDEIARISQDQNVEYVQPNYIYHIQMTDPNDQYFGLQRGLKNIGQNGGLSGADIQRNEAMDIRSGDGNPLTTGTIVAVLDVGVEYTHPDLVHQMWNGANCLNTNGATRGGCLGGGYNAYLGTKTAGIGNHGTHVAGIIGAEMNNLSGVVGVNPHAKIMNINLGDGENISTLAAISALSFAKYNGAKIANLSRGGIQNGCSSYDAALYTAIKNFPGLVVIAAGNESTQHTGTYFFYPADFSANSSCRSGLDNIISVAASDNTDHLASFSDYGTKVHIAAPGAAIASTRTDGGYQYLSGTSMASPMVAGAVSLLRSMKPELSYSDIKNILLNYADVLPSLNGKVAGSRRLNIFKALQAIYRPVKNLQVFTDETKTTNIINGGGISGNSIYVEWEAPTDLGQISGYDSVSGYAIKFYISGTVIYETGIQTTGISLNLSGDGAYTIAISTVFSGGKKGTNAYFGLSRDTLPPTANVVYSPASGTMTSGNVIATLTGRNEPLFNINTTGHTFTGNDTFVFTFSDIMGRTGSVTGTVLWIDKIAPTATIVYTPGSGSVTSGNVIATISGSETIIVTNNSGSNQYTFTNTGTFTFTFKDLAGNTGIALATVSWIDKIAPTATIVYTNTGGNVLATLTGLSESCTGFNATGKVFTSNGTFIFTFTDLAGNPGSVNATAVVSVQGTTSVSGSVYIGGSRGTGVIFTSTGIVIINSTGNTNNYLQINTSGFVIQTSGGVWNGIIMPPAQGANPALGIGGLPGSSTNNGSTTDDILPCISLYLHEPVEIYFNSIGQKIERLGQVSRVVHWIPIKYVVLLPIIYHFFPASKRQ